MSYQTGYFASQKRPDVKNKTHIVNHRYQPVCGTKLSQDMRFQWCASDVQADYVDCKKCNKWINKNGVEIEQK